MTAPNLSRVADAGPIIVLAKVGRLDVLTAGGRSVFITETVAREVEAGRDGDPARQALQSGWGTRTADVPLSEDLAAWNLDAGEQSVLALARETGAVAVLDDGAGRKAARALSVPHTGTLGLVIEAKRQGLVTSAVNLLRDLRQAGLYLPDDGILEAVLQTVGEEW